MPDMLVKLYNLEEKKEYKDELLKKGIMIRKAISPEKHIITKWVEKHFNEHWKSEAESAFSNNPVSILIAIDIEKGKMIGFSCYESTCKNFFGPTGVDEEYRGKGIGKVLYLQALYELKHMGYAYCIIGDAGPIDFYKKHSDAYIIENSSPGIYEGILR
ncbi:GNAT family N-acetyltransferase [Oceanotoga sp. DSM 15011]|uniref:GNAT family N-acetyltransferase n=1 Tax=Oceanotoga sp. DSM 15011 TaxID=2984951 RepID=UPI0021F47652|nr:GNAT family N-acetyltransferase [Oceanotoga sp. DSM 15011]UYO99340.1 GNAT family N-acetyltransferase [Oceanotoga sp. DSM 15011]